MSSSRDDACGTKMPVVQCFDEGLAWRRRAGTAFLVLILGLALHAPAGAQNVEEKQEQEYLEDIIRKDEDVSTKSQPQEKGKEKSGDVFTEDPADESSKTLSPEDREKVRVQNDLLGDDDNQLTQEQKHQADVYVSAQLDRKIEKFEGKVPDEDLEHYLDYTPSPEARGNPNLKAYERKLWQQSVRDYKSARLQEQLLAELDGPSDGAAGSLPNRQQPGSGSGGAGGGLSGIGSLAELFGRSTTSGSGPASGADEAAKSPDAQGSSDTAKQAATQQQRQAQPETPPLGDQTPDASMSGNAESDPDATVPATPSKPSAAFSEVVAQSGIAEAEGGRKVEDAPQGAGGTEGPSAPPTERTADAEDTSPGSSAEAAAQSSPVQTETAPPEIASTSPASAAGGSIDDGTPSSEDVSPGIALPQNTSPENATLEDTSPEKAPTENVSPEDTSLASAGSGRSGNFAQQFSLDEELGAVNGSAADKPEGQNQGSGAEDALPRTAAQLQQQRLEETLATLKWQRNLADPEKAAGDPLSEDETAAVRRAGKRIAQDPERAERLGQDVQAREALLEDLQQDAEAIDAEATDAETVDAETSAQNAALQAALSNTADISEGRLQYRPAGATPREQPGTATGTEPTTKGAEEITLEHPPAAGSAAPTPRRETFLSRLQQDLQRLRLRLLHDQADSFLWACLEPSCSLPGGAGPVEAGPGGAAGESGQQHSQP